MSTKHRVVPLRELSDDWKADIVSGPFGSNLKREHFKAEGVPVLKIQNVKSFELKLNKLDYVSPQKANELKRHSFVSGDIVVTKLGSPLGAAAIVEDIDDGIIVADLVRIRANKINTKYLCYHINSPESQAILNAEHEGATRPRIKLDVLRDLPILTPSLPEQERIVAILDEAFAAIATAANKTEKNISNTKGLFESNLKAIFSQEGNGWVENKLGDLSEIQSGGTPLRSKSEFWGGKIAWYSSGELNHLYTRIPERHISQEGLRNSNAKLFPKGSLLIGMYDTAALKMSILDRDAAFNQAIAGIKPNDNINLHFIRYAVSAIRTEILSLRRGVRQKNLNLGKIKDVLSALPSLNEQNAIVSNLDSLGTEVTRLVSTYHQKLRALAELKQSILFKAFTGELPVDSNAIGRALSEAPE